MCHKIKEVPYHNLKIYLDCYNFCRSAPINVFNFRNDKEEHDINFHDIQLNPFSANSTTQPYLCCIISTIHIMIQFLFSNFSDFSGAIILLLKK